MKNKKKRLLALTLIASLVSMILYLSLSAIYTVLGSNIVYGSYLIIIDVLMWIVNVLSYAAIFSVFIYSTAKNGVKNTLPLVLIYCGIVLAKNLFVPVINGIVLGVGLSATDFLYPIFVWMLDAVLAFAVLFVSHLKKDNTRTASLIVGIILSATTLLPRIVFDLGYGAPSNLYDLLVVLAAYASDFLVVAIFFFGYRFIFKYLQRG